MLPCEVDVFGESEVMKIAFCQAGAAFESKVLVEKLIFRKVKEQLVQDEALLYQIRSFDALNSGYFVYEVFSHPITLLTISWTVLG
jgi:hypothetical protein